MEAIELRRQSEELEKRVNILVNDFIDRVGQCVVKIDVQQEWGHFIGGEKVIAGTVVRVEVTV